MWRALGETTPPKGPNRLFPSLKFMPTGPVHSMLGQPNTAQNTSKKGQKAHHNFEGVFPYLTGKFLCTLPKLPQNRLFHHIQFA